MNKELNHNYIIESAALLVPVLPFNNHEIAALLNCRVAFFMSTSSIQPKSTKLDYIEAKTTLGGRTNDSIQDTNSIIFLVFQYKQCSTATYDLTQPKDNAAKLNCSSTIDTSEMDVKGLIESKYQFLK